MCKNANTAHHVTISQEWAKLSTPEALITMQSDGRLGMRALIRFDFIIGLAMGFVIA